MSWCVRTTPANSVALSFTHRPNTHGAGKSCWKMPEPPDPARKQRNVSKSVEICRIAVRPAGRAGSARNIQLCKDRAGFVSQFSWRSSPAKRSERSESVRGRVYTCRAKLQRSTAGHEALDSAATACADRSCRFYKDCSTSRDRVPDWCANSLADTIRLLNPRSGRGTKCEPSET